MPGVKRKITKEKGHSLWRLPPIHGRQAREPGLGFSTAHRATAPAWPQLVRPCTRHVLAKRSRHQATAPALPQLGHRAIAPALPQLRHRAIAPALPQLVHRAIAPALPQLVHPCTRHALAMPSPCRLPLRGLSSPTHRRTGKQRAIVALIPQWKSRTEQERGTGYFSGRSSELYIALTTCKPQFTLGRCSNWSNPPTSTLGCLASATFGPGLASRRDWIAWPMGTSVMSNPLAMASANCGSTMDPVTGCISCNVVRCS